jgi:hypothetical protein
VLLILKKEPALALAWVSHFNTIILTKLIMILKYIPIIGFCALLLNSCATSGLLLKDTENFNNSIIDASTMERFYIIGNASKDESSAVLSALESVVSETPSEENHLIFIGDNTNEKKEANVKSDLDRQIKTVKKLNIDPFFVPGNYEWEFNSVKGLETIEDYLKDKLDKEDPLTPNNGCPMESIEIGDDIQLIIFDSQWYIEDWDRNTTMNDKCDIKSREKLLYELENEIKKSANRTILFVMHHPLYTNGFHGGKFAIRDHIFPLRGPIPAPVIASVIAEVRSQGAVSAQDRYNKIYDEMAYKIGSILNHKDKRIVVISGHEENLQYIENENIKQIISGAGSKTNPASIGENGLFSYGKNGFAVVDVAKDGRVAVHFYSAKNGAAQLLFSKEIFPPTPEPTFEELPTVFPATYDASVYDIEKLEKSPFFKSFWGNHYRDVYGTKVTARTALLDTLYGGLTVIRPGGGHQTKSLRVETKDGKEYNMRALKKSAVQFLETTIFKGINGQKYLGNTIPENLILDFYTAAHPYGAFAIPTLAKAAEVYYTTPELYFVPKQKALGKYSDEYGDQLFMIVEKPSEEYTGRKSFGYPDDIESTDDLLATLRKDEEYTLDENAYIRARLFDMLLGDWDRHEDQWRWAEFEEGDKKVFVPIPRDRDQVFANFDGSFLNVLRNLMGSVNQFGVYGEDISDVEWFNKAGSKLDRALLKRTNKNDWIKEATFLQNAIDENLLNAAFKKLPIEVQDSTTEEIKQHFLKRKNNLVAIAERYYDVFIKFQMLTGTDKDDYFDITRNADGTTDIQAYRIKDGEKGDLLFNRTFDSKETEEVWLYGLDDKDTFEVKGEAKDAMTIRIIGGQDKDTYIILEGKNIKVYDRNLTESKVEKKGGAYFRFTDFYEANLYDYKKAPKKGGGIRFDVGFNPDQGMILDAGYEKTVNNFIENPYGRLTAINAQYHFLTQGIDVRLKKGYAAIFKDFNLILEGRFTSNNYTENYFGFGNDSYNDEDIIALDFNQVNLAKYEGGIGVERSSDYGSSFQLKYDIQSTEVVAHGNNFIANSTFERLGERFYFGVPNVTYQYKNFDEDIFPTKGMLFHVKASAIDDLGGANLTGILNSKVSFYNSLLNSRKLVLKTAAQTQLNFGDRPEFYQLATLGGDNGLRGYRHQRFSGDRSFSASSDVAYQFNKIKTAFFPIDLSAYVGVDLGRVWIEGDNSKNWHNSYGGGVLLQWTQMIHAGFSAFKSEEGTRISFSTGLRL